MNKSVPSSVDDVLLHVKDSESTEKVVLPITRYGNVLHSPKVIGNVEDTNGAPFVMYASDTEELSADDIRDLCGDIL